MKHNQPDALAKMNRSMRDPLTGKYVIINKGEWKGYKGRVCRADDKQVIVELSSKCKQIALEKSFVELEKQNTITKDDQSMGGQTIYEPAGKTPMQINTPSYYPFSPHWGAAQSDCKLLIR